MNCPHCKAPMIKLVVVYRRDGDKPVRTVWKCRTPDCGYREEVSHEGEDVPDLLTAGAAV